MIRVNSISKIYRRGDGAEVAALRDISFAVEKGEFLTIRGASGSGKSSLLNILGCLDTPSTGSYVLDQEEVSGFADRKLSRVRNRKIGFVFQSFQLLPRTTAVENVEIPMIYRDGRVNRKRALSVLERVGLLARAHHYGSELSGGEQQRVAIARALINSPALILADEPTGNLDQKAGFEIMQILKDLHVEGRTIALVTHDDAIASFARRQILLRDGAIVSDGPVHSGATLRG